MEQSVSFFRALCEDSNFTLVKVANEEYSQVSMRNLFDEYKGGLFNINDTINFSQMEVMKEKMAEIELEKTRKVTEVTEASLSDESLSDSKS